PNEWSLIEMAIEVCDGCPYSDVDADTAYWLNTIGYFCPWSGQPLKEVSAPTGMEDVAGKLYVRIYPNPAINSLFINHHHKGEATLTLHDISGRLVYEEQHCTGKMLNVRPYAEGLYWLT